MPETVAFPVSIPLAEAGHQQLGVRECDARPRPHPVPPLAVIPSPALGPACPRVDPSFARLARDRSGARARPRSGRREAAGAGLRTCQTHGADLELRALQAKRSNPLSRLSGPSCVTRPLPSQPGAGR